MKLGIIGLVMWLATIAIAQGSSIWNIAGTDLFSRDWDGSLELTEDMATIDLTFTGDDGVTDFAGTFTRALEAGMSGDPQLTTFVDLDGPIGGQITLEGLGINSFDVEVSTNQDITDGTLIVWNGITDFQSAGPIATATVQSISVPEPSTLLGLAAGSIVLFGLAWMRA